MKNADQTKEDFSKGFNDFLSRTGIKGVEIAKKFNLNPASVSCWKIKKALPNFDKAVNLIEMGMTAQEMFGKELADKLFESYVNEKKETNDPYDYNSPKFREAVKSVVAEEILKNSFDTSIKRLLNNYDIHKDEI